jgi:hypothetical protein
MLDLPPGNPLKSRWFFSVFNAKIQPISENHGKISGKSDVFGGKFPEKSLKI